MPKFFQKRRKEVLNQSRLGRYLIYASGEIVLVMVGILLALQVNKWQENKKNEALLGRIHKTLLDEVQSNISELDTTIAYRAQLVSNIKNEKHLAFSIPLKELGLRSNDLAAIESNIASSMFLNSRSIPEKVKLHKIGSKTFLQIDRLKFNMQEEDGHLNFYGQSGIQLKRATLSNHAWEIMSATNASVLMDYDLVFIMNDINNLLGKYQDTASEALKGLYENRSDILPILQDMHWYERQLKEKYETISQQF